MSYRRHSNGKGARQAHHRREKARRRKLREKGGQVCPFGFADTRGKSRKALRIMSVTKGGRDGAPRLVLSCDSGSDPSGRRPEGAECEASQSGHEVASPNLYRYRTDSGE